MNRKAMHVMVAPALQVSPLAESPIARAFSPLEICCGLGEGQFMEFFKGWTGVLYVLGLIGAGLALEAIFPWRKAAADAARWLRNASMTFYGAIILSLIPFLAGYGVALSAEQSGAGLFNQVTMPLWVELVLALIILDGLTYVQHRILHSSYAFWRIHRVHHTDKHIDVTTSLRFHPFETVFRTALEALTVFALGIPPEAILLTFAALALANTFTHLNIALPDPVERVLSVVFITPPVHRLHHAAGPDNLHSNFGTVLTLWDHLCGTYRGAAHLKADEVFGVSGAEDLERESFANLALDPLRKPQGAQVPKPSGVEANEPSA